MKDLIKALQIFLKYSDADYPTSCEHDTLHVCVDKEGISEEDIKELEKLSFTYGEETESFYSYKYGSC